YWSLGDAPDLSPQASAYDYVNDFREFFNALKQEDPSLIVMGPNLAFPDGRSGTEWMGAFLRYDGDIVNLASVQHYACGAVSQLSPGGLWDDVRGLTPAYRALQGRVCQDSDLYLPVVYTRMGLYPGTDVPEDFTQTLWRAEVLGTLLQEGAEMMVAGDLEGPGKTGLFAQGVPDPAARVLELFSAVWKGIPVPAKAKKNGIDVFAAQDPVTRDLSLFIVNRNTRYEWMDVSLDGHGDNLVVEAGLSRRFRLEVPDQALVAVRAPADGSPVTVEVYGAAQAKKGGGPLSETLRP
ncbi:MAG TPA: hypothetical protein VFR02_00100, partial [bacterium]|nr:hypothetical protein [bacterium]